MSHRLLEADDVAGSEGAQQDDRGHCETAQEGHSWFPPGVKGAVFDVVGTLVEPSPSVAAAYQQAARRQGLNISEAELSGRFASAWKRQEAIDAVAQPPYATSREREQQRWRGVVHDVFAGLADPSTADDIFDDLWRHFARPTAWQATELGLALVADAIDAGLEVALASNFDERLFEVAETVEPLVQAAHVFPSSELGWRKPSPAFFRAVEERLNLLPAELVMFGDNAELDVAAAQRAGWHAVLLPSS
jgi:putative hydrolase of the HAD superfamily